MPVNIEPRNHQNRHRRSRRQVWEFERPKTHGRLWWLSFKHKKDIACSSPQNERPGGRTRTLAFHTWTCMFAGNQDTMAIHALVLMAHRAGDHRICCTVPAEYLFPNAARIREGFTQQIPSATCQIALSRDQHVSPSPWPTVTTGPYSNHQPQTALTGL